MKVNTGHLCSSRACSYFTRGQGRGGCAGAMSYYTAAGEPPGQWAGKGANEAVTCADRVAARVVLIDGITLARLMATHNIGVQDRETYVIKRVDEDFFEERKPLPPSSSLHDCLGESAVSGSSRKRSLRESSRRPPPEGW